jgi:hypothetical protein
LLHTAPTTTHPTGGSRTARVIAIIDGGFSGVSVAIHLLRQPTTTP